MTFQNPLLAVPSRPPPIKVAVVGAGTIGPDIGYYLSSSLGCGLVLVDVDSAALNSAVETIEAYVEKGLSRDKLSPEQAEGVSGIHLLRRVQ